MPEVPQEVVDAVLAAKARGNRVIAVGTYLGTFAGERGAGGERRADRAVLRRNADFHLPGLSVPGDRCAGD